LILSILLSLNLYSQQELKYDSSKIEVRIPDYSKIEDFRNMPEFQYEKNYEAPVTLWDRIIFWLLKQLSKLFGNTGSAPYIRYLIIGLLIFGFVLLFLNTNVQALFFKSKRHLKIDYNISDEDLSKMNLDELIDNEIRNKSYRTAVRYLFLKTLKILTEKQIIEWKINKTNRDFLVEVKERKYYQTFKNISQTFEYVWYGNFNLNSDEFVNIHKKFIEFFKVID